MKKKGTPFIPYPVNEGDEIFPNGIFEFNITRLIEFIHSHPEEFSSVEVKVGEFFKEFSSINERHMDAVVLSEPVILAEIAPGHFNLIDGNHRMEKARRLGRETIMAYKVKSEQHRRFLTSEKAYAAYVIYWNEKL